MYRDFMKVIVGPDRIRPPGYVVDRIADFPDVGIPELILRIPGRKTEIYRELGGEVFSVLTGQTGLPDIRIGKTQEFQSVKII